METSLAAIGWVAWYTQVVAPLLLCSSIPLGTPPAPADPELARMAPPECAVYCSWAGTTTPDPNSPNRAERFLADPEIQHLRSEAARRFRLLAQSMLKDQLQLSDQGRHLVEAQLPMGCDLLTSEPGMLYVRRLEAGDRATHLAAALVLRTGDRQVEVAAFLEELQKLNPELIETSGQGESLEYRLKSEPGPLESPPVRWALRGRYLILTFGGESPNDIANRRNGPEPQWLAALAMDLPTERRVAVLHIACQPLQALLEQMAADQKAAMKKELELHASENKEESTEAKAAEEKPASAEPLPAWLRQVQSVTLATSLEGEDFVGRVLVKLHEPLASLVHLGASRPLTADCLASIPQDATLAVAARLEPAQLLMALPSLGNVLESGNEGVLDVADTLTCLAYPLIGQAVQETANSLAPMLGDTKPPKLPTSLPLNAALCQELTASLGDVWCFYISPGEGMLLCTGATLTVSVRDHDRLAKALETLAQRQPTSDPPAQGKEADSAASEIRKAAFAGHDIYYLAHAGSDTLGTFAWCLTDQALVCATSPQNIKAYLLRKADQPSLATSPAAVEVLQAAAPPMAMVYENTPELFRLTYPLLQGVANYVNSHGSLKLNSPDPMLLPAAPTIAQYLRPAVTTLESTPQGVSLTVRQSLPSGNLGATAWVVGCAMLPSHIGDASPGAAMLGGDMTPAPKHPAIPPANFVDSKEGPCTLKEQGPNAPSESVQIGHELKGDCSFYLEDFFGQQCVHVGARLENTSQRPLQCQINVAFFDKAGKLVACSHKYCEKIAAGSNGYPGGGITFLSTGVAETVTSYQLTYYESDVPPEPEKDAASNTPAATNDFFFPFTSSGPLPPMNQGPAVAVPVEGTLVSSEGMQQSQFHASLLAGRPNRPGDFTGRWDLPLTFSETKEGTCRLKLTDNFDDPDAAISVPLGNHLKLTYRFRLGMSNEDTCAFYSEQEFKTPADHAVTYDCHISFFDKEGKLVCTDHIGDNQCLVRDCHSRLGEVILYYTDRADQVVSYKLVYYEFEQLGTEAPQDTDAESTPPATESQ